MLNVPHITMVHCKTGIGKKIGYNKQIDPSVLCKQKRVAYEHVVGSNAD